MATVSATFTFGLPEDIDTNYLYIYSATTENGTYSLAAAIAYEYGVVTYEYDSTDTTKWYKIRFYNSTDAEYGPYSDPVYGGSFDNAAPFLAVSTTTDGCHYASTSDVYDYANLTTSDVTVSKVSKALKRARAVIDLRTTELDLDRFDLYDTEIQRKKYNATLRILKEAEINIALGHLFKGIADEITIERTRDSSTKSPSISVGNTSLGNVDADDRSTVSQLTTLGDRYLITGAAMLAQIQPTSLRFTPQETTLRSSPRFVWPFNGFRY